MDKADVVPLLREDDEDPRSSWDHHEDDERRSKEVKRNGLIGIQINTPESSVRTDSSILNRFPKEKRKTLLAFAFLNVGFIVNSVAITLTNDRVPDRETYGPLPDIFLDSVDAVPFANHISDLLVVLTAVTAVIVIAFHQHRWILARRIFFILGILYLMRSVTMYVTNLPLSSKTVYCAPKQNTTSLSIVAKRSFRLFAGLGLPVFKNKVVCGDYIFSGHTCILVTSYLTIREYSPRRMVYLHWAIWIAAGSGMILVLYAHGHYTVDVIIGYFATTRVFWSYHTLANNPCLKRVSVANFIGREWWFPFFQYLEGNVRGPLPSEYSVPWSRKKVQL